MHSMFFILMGREKYINSKPPSRSKGIISDVRNFLLHRPYRQTHIKFKSEEERLFYSKRIVKRLGVNVEGYNVLNIHQIGIDVPPDFAFNELLNWNGDSTCWPNHIARVERVNNGLEKIHINLFGKTRLPFGLSHLFDLDSIKIQNQAENSDPDNASYLLYKCSGGYPIGIFFMLVRSPIAEHNESEECQLFFTVGFNFYGRKNWTEKNVINTLWESVHDRVTSNTMIRFKQLCEWKFGKNMEKPDSNLFAKGSSAQQVY